MHSITLRFLAPFTGPHPGGRVSGGTVLGWVDEAGFACASAWAHGDCATAFIGSVHFLRPVHSGELVEVRAHLAFTGETSMSLAIEVSTGPVGAGSLHEVLHCAAVYVALNASGSPRAVDWWTAETPGDMALAERVQAQIASAQGQP